MGGECSWLDRLYLFLLRFIFYIFNLELFFRFCFFVSGGFGVRGLFFFGLFLFWFYRGL